MSHCVLNLYIMECYVQKRLEISHETLELLQGISPELEKNPRSIPFLEDAIAQCAKIVVAQKAQIEQLKSGSVTLERELEAQIKALMDYGIIEQRELFIAEALKEKIESSKALILAKMEEELRRKKAMFGIEG